ncbi:hypothetical protein HPP92_013615 [Vanilla planifolia]|uniref:C2H2-type domain-containing protein n=1 Tax=Vanilla planifolia TaxID=51239 RepID=A0A835QSN1_VANPL|nr:hypothetical protein HPP92_013615 [Vanilla planifolia]
MEISLELRKAICKICSKSFSSGRALGGHMRSHRHSSSEAEEGDKVEGSKGEMGVGVGYDLRENPKKTWRVSDFVGEGEDSFSKNCNDSGKEFPSWKAPLGQMRIQPARRSPPRLEAEDFDERFSDGHELLPPPPAPKKKRRSKRASPEIVPAGLSSLITEYEREQEEVAISLIMLSRDTGGYLIAAESSDKNSVVMEGVFFEDNDFDLWKKRATHAENKKPFSSFNAQGLGSGYQCATCKKNFHSYHALGGHRASHKRIRSLCSPKINNGSCENASHEPSTDHPAAVNHSALGSSKKNRINDCVICGKIFSSAQALGGHKRSHLVSRGGSADQHIPALSQLLDPNLPASLDEASSNIRNLSSLLRA